MPSLSPLALFPPALVEAVRAAIEACIEFQDTFEAFVLQKLGGLGCTPVLLRKLTVEAGAGEEAAGREALAELAHSPRGSCILLRIRIAQDGIYRYRAWLRNPDPEGSVRESHAPLDWTTPATALVRWQRAHDIYACRRTVEARQKSLENELLARQHRVVIGQTYVGPLRIGRQVFQVGTVTALGDDGTVTLSLVHQATGKRFKGTFPVKQFLALVAAAKAERHTPHDSQELTLQA